MTIESNLAIWLLYTTPNAPIFVLADLYTGSVPLGPSGAYGTTQLAFSPFLLALADPLGQFGTGIAPSFTNGAGQWTAVVPVPLDPLLLGVTIYSEAYILDFLAPNFFFHQSNLLTVTFQ